jgi:hypothetical protein
MGSFSKLSTLKLENYQIRSLGKLGSLSLCHMC